MKLSSTVAVAAISCLGVFAFAQDNQESTPDALRRFSDIDLFMAAILESASPNAASTAEQVALRRRQTELAEDMEIIAAIVHENVGSRYLPFREPVVDPHAHFPDLLGDLNQWHEEASVRQTMPTSNAVSQPLVEYLPGHGVTIQLRVPAPRMARTEAQKKTAAKMSRWERTKKRLHGKETPTQVFGRTCEQCHQASARVNVNQLWWSMFERDHALGNVAESLVRGPTKSSLVHALVTALAENGHNVRGLDPSERITISLNYWLDDERQASVDGSDDSKKSDSHEYQKELGKESAKATGKQQKQPKKAASAALRTELNGTVVRPLSSNPVAGTVQPQTKNVIERLMIDRWIKAEASSSLTESRTNLVRRAHLDLLGLPPTNYQIRDFLADGSSDAYQRLIDRLLNSGDHVDSSIWRWVGPTTNQSTTTQSRAPQRGRISVSATSEQLAKVAQKELSEVEFMQQVQIRIFEP